MPAYVDGLGFASRFYLLEAGGLPECQPDATTKASPRWKSARFRGVCIHPMDVNRTTRSGAAKYEILWSADDVTMATADEIRTRFKNREIPIGACVRPARFWTLFNPWIPILEFVGIDKQEILNEGIAEVAAFARDLMKHTGQEGDPFHLRVAYLDGAVMNYVIERLGLHTKVTTTSLISFPDCHRMTVEVQRQVFGISAEEADANLVRVISQYGEVAKEIVLLGLKHFDNWKTNKTEFNATGFAEAIRILRGTMFSLGRQLFSETHV